jgi:hypothetical protein
MNIHNSFTDHDIKTGITYDLVIVGAGPSGLALATMAIEQGYTILVIEKEKSVGGCHRVRRDTSGNFSEHGPRIYTNSSRTFMKLLKHMGMDFYNYFTDYKWNNTLNEIIYKQLSSKELLSITLAVLRLVIDSSFGIDVSLKAWLESKEFSQESVKLLDNTCKFIDGGGVDKYSLNKFIQIINTQFLYSMYQPIAPNDTYLFYDWKQWLDKKGVVFLLETEIIDISINKSIISLTNKVDYLIGSTKEDLVQIKGNDYIFACPPMHTKGIIDNISDKTIDKTIFFGKDFGTFAEKTNYIPYVSMTFQWNEPQVFENRYGFTNGETPYDLIFLVLSDYMTYDFKGTFISVAVSNVNSRSPRNNKTALECTESELVRETFEQLREYLSLPNVFDSFTYSVGNGIDTAFIQTFDQNPLPFKSPLLDNLYTVGSHTGLSSTPLTSIESAVENSVVLFNNLYSPNSIRLGFRYTLVHIIVICVVVLLIILFKVFL